MSAGQMSRHTPLDPERYGALIAEWCGVQPGQPVLIAAESTHKLLAEAAAAAATRRSGGAPVTVHLLDTRRDLERLQGESLEQLRSVESWLLETADRLVAGRGAFIRIAGDDSPPEIQEVDPERIDALRSARREALTNVSREIMAGRMNRCLVAAPTARWAARVFPDDPPATALRRLEAAIASACCLDEDDPEAAFNADLDLLDRQRDYLQGLRLQTLRFEAPGTNLTIGLSPRAVWLAGRKETADERRITFLANVPVGEIFTTPDWRTVNGTVAITMPAVIDNVVVRDIELEFVNGSVVRSRASEGQEVLDLLLRKEGDRRLGEVALVSLDSRVARLGRLFFDTLFDEKARCHIALGKAYLTNIAGGAVLPESEYGPLGINLTTPGGPEVTRHEDLMVSSAETRVTGVSHSGEQVVLLEKGLWAA